MRLARVKTKRVKTKRVKTKRAKRPMTCYLANPRGCE
jgi:hypothetical protein